MQTQFKLVASLMGILILVAGCGKAEPTATLVPSTATAMPLPTATSVLPTDVTSLPAATQMVPTDTSSPPIANPIAESTFEGARVTFVNNDGFLITVGDKRVLIDVLYEGYPEGVLKPVVYAQPPFDGVDLILATHEHQDHFSPELVLRYMKNNPNTVFVSTQSAIDQILAVDDSIQDRLIPIQLSKGESEKIVVSDIALEAIHISHGIPDLLNLGFVITVGQVKFFHAGDIVPDDVPASYLQAYGLREKQIDVQFVPYFFMIPGDYQPYIWEEVQPRYIIPMHYDHQQPPLELEDSFPNVVVFHDTLESWVLPVDAEGTQETPAEPSLSGDAEGLIAFYSERDGNAEIYTMNTDGNGQTRLTDNTADDMNPEWSPDGQRLVFISDRDDPNPVKCFPQCDYEIYVMDVDGSNQQRLTDEPAADYHPTWSPDGAQIAFVSERDGNQEIYVMDADGSNVRRLTDNSAQDMRPTWSPDGMQIAFNTERDGNWEIYVMDADGDDQQRLTTTDTWEFFPAWSPDGAEIAFFACDPQCRSNQQDIYVMNSDGSNIRRLTDSPSTVDEDPAWSPDGKKIVFQSDRDRNFEIYTMNVDGSDQRRLTNHRGGDYWPSWGPQPAMPAATFSLEESPQEFDARGTFQAGLGDLDGDGDLDAVFANPQQHNSEVWLNDGSGTFVDTGQQLTQYGHGVGMADFDGDGDLDAAIACHQFIEPSKVYLNDGNANLQATGQDLGDARISGADLNLVDVNGDGHMDVHVMYYDPQGLPDKVYLNDGTGTFTDSGLAFDEEVIAWGDLDADGDVDLFGKRWGEGYVVQLNDGSGQFSESWTMEDSQSMDGGIALADFDGDGDLDALVANGFRAGGSHPTILLWNDGTGQFTDGGQRLNKTMLAELATGDLDGDGDLDVFVSNMDLPNEVWLNDGHGSFVDTGLRLGKDTDISTKPSLADLDGDGDLDVFAGSLMGRPEIWFNTTPNSKGIDSKKEGLYLGQKPPGLEMEVFAPGIVSIEEGKEYKIAISPDLQEVFFARRTPGGRDDRLWYSHLEDGKLTMPELAPFAYDGLESDACFTPDGKRLYFNSRRPLPGEETPSAHLNVWFVDKIDDGWSEPQFLGPPLNDYRPVYFSIADDETLYFTHSSPREIWYAEPKDGRYSEAQRLPDEINYLTNVAHPAIAPDESYIIVDSYYERGGRLVGYLYISFRKPDGSWTQAVNVRGALNASDADIHASPRITPDGKYLFFEDYEREMDKADIYWVSTEVIENMKATVLK